MESGFKCHVIEISTDHGASAGRGGVGLLAGVGKGKNQLVSDTQTLILCGSGRQGCGSRQGRINTAAILARGTCYV